MVTIIQNHPVNLSLAERMARITVGVLGAAGAVVWLALAPSVVVAVGALLIAAAGIDLVFTGARGYCPLYAWLARRSSRSTGR